MKKILAVLKKVEAAGEFTDELRAEAAREVSHLTLEEIEFVKSAFEIVLERIAQRP